MHSMRKLLSRPNHEGVMTHYVTIRAEAESPDALVVLLTAETNGIAGVLGVDAKEADSDLIERLSSALAANIRKETLELSCERERNLAELRVARELIQEQENDLAKLKAELEELRPRAEKQADPIPSAQTAAAPAAADPTDQVNFEDFNGAMRKRASDLREAEPVALWFRRKRFVPEPKRLSDESATKLKNWIKVGPADPIDPAIREALSILRPELLRG